VLQRISIHIMDYWLGYLLGTIAIWLLVVVPLQAAAQRRRIRREIRSLLRAERLGLLLDKNKNEIEEQNKHAFDKPSHALDITLRDLTAAVNRLVDVLADRPNRPPAPPKNPP
jgi:hypothetical protein